MLNLLNFARRRLPLFAVLSVAATLLVWSYVVIAQESPPEPYPERTLVLGQTKTIGDFTVELIEARDTEEGLKIVHTYRTDLPEITYLPVGSPKIQFADGSISRAGPSGRVNETTDIDTFEREPSSRIPGADDNVDLGLGSFIVAKPDITSTVNIPLGTEYADIVSGGSESNQLSLEIDFSVAEAQFRVTTLTSHDFGLNLLITPVNESAKKIILGTGTGAPADVTLTDDKNSVFSYQGGAISWEDIPSSQLAQWQSFDFAGVPVGSATSMTLNIRGGGEVIGPFVFDNIALVSEDIPPVTPVPPGGVGPGDPIPTPPNVND